MDRRKFILGVSALAIAAGYAGAALAASAPIVAHIEGLPEGSKASIEYKGRFIFLGDSRTEGLNDFVIPAGDEFFVRVWTPKGKERRFDMMARWRHIARLPLTTVNLKALVANYDREKWDQFPPSPHPGLVTDHRAPAQNAKSDEIIGRFQAAHADMLRAKDRLRSRQTA